MATLLQKGKPFSGYVGGLRLLLFTLLCQEDESQIGTVWDSWFAGKLDCLIMTRGIF